MKILLTGSQGFIGSYICNELLSNGYSVVGVDNFSKYGKLSRPHDTHENFKLIEMLNKFKDKIFNNYTLISVLLILAVLIIPKAPDIIIIIFYC